MKRSSGDWDACSFTAAYSLLLFSSYIIIKPMFRNWINTPQLSYYLEIWPLLLFFFQSVMKCHDVLTVAR